MNEMNEMNEINIYELIKAKAMLDIISDLAADNNLTDYQLADLIRKILCVEVDD